MPSNELHALCKGTPTPATLAEILTREPKLAEVVAKYGSTALHYLCDNNKVTLEMIKVYLEHAPGAAEVVDEDGYTALRYLCENKHSTTEMRSALEAAHPEGPKASNLLVEQLKYTKEYLGEMWTQAMKVTETNNDKLLQVGASLELILDTEKPALPEDIELC